MPSISRKAKQVLADRGIQIVITSKAYRDGQAAARRDFEVDPDSTPNHLILSRLKSHEFASGYVDEWTHFLAPERARQMLSDW